MANTTIPDPAAPDFKSSVELSMNAKGRVQINVKSRNEDIMVAAEEASKALGASIGNVQKLGLTLASDAN